MPIYRQNPLLLATDEQIATQSTAGEAFAALGGEAMESGLLGATGRREELNYAEGDFGFTAGEYGIRSDLAKMKPLSALLTPEQARAKLRDNNLAESLDVPQTGIREETLSILIERKIKEQRRQTILAQSSGWGAKAAGFTGAFVGSLADPTNIALAFVPVVGEAKYAQLLARAGGGFGRAGVRVGVGATEGLVGLAPVEALNYMANIQQQADYDAYDSMLAIAGGAGFGAALHGGAGLFGDLWRGGGRPRVEPPQPGVVTPPARTVPDAPPVLDMAARERLMVLDRLSEGKAVTRQQAESLGVRSGTEAATVIDDRLAALARVSQDGRLDPERVRALVAEADELSALVQAQDRAARDGVILAPGNRLTPEERAVADQRRVEIKSELERHRQAQDAATELTDLNTKLGKIDADADLIKLADRLSPRAEAESFVDGLSPAVARELAADPFMPIRPFLATRSPETQAASLRMAIGQALDGRPVDVSPVMLADRASYDGALAMSNAEANTRMAAGADDAASRQASEVVPDEGQMEELKELFDYESKLVDKLYDDAGIELRESDTAAMKDIDNDMRRSKAAVEAANACLMRTGL